MNIVLGTSFLKSRGTSGLAGEAREICLLPARKSVLDAVKERVKSGLVAYVIYLVILAPVHFFVGAAIGGIDAGFKHVALFLSLSVFLLFFFIPGMGILMAAWYGTISNELMVLLGISHNFWVDIMIISTIHVTGVIVQVVLMTWLLVTLVSSRVKSREARPEL